MARLVISKHFLGIIFRNRYTTKKTLTPICLLFTNYPLTKYIYIYKSMVSVDN